MRALLSALPLAALLATSLAADVDATNPEAMRALMESHGKDLEVGIDDVGDPKITGSLRDITYTLFFYGCSGGRYCTNIQFQTGFDLSDGMTAEKVNEWNRDQRWASAFLDEENDPFLQMDMNLGAGVDDSTFVETYRIWLTSLNDFMDFIDW